MSPQVEFKAESDNDLRDRFVDAMVPEFTAGPEMIAKPNTRPGAQRKHIFDFEDGARIIVSRDVLENMTSVHFSISIEEGQIYDSLAASMGEMPDTATRDERIEALENLFTERILPRVHDLAEKCPVVDSAELATLEDCKARCN